MIRCLRGGAFILAELDGAVWQNRIAAFRVVPNLSNNHYRVGLHLCRYLLATRRYQLVYNGLSSYDVTIPD